MRDDFRAATSHRQKRRCTILGALLLLVATTACSVGGAAPQPGPSATALPSATTIPSATRSYTNAHVIDKYKTLIPQIMKENNIPGLSLAVVDDKEVIWAQGFGVTDPVQNKPVTENTLFSVQSMSKNFTAMAVLMAAEEGLVDVNTPITTYLPDFHVNSPFEAHPEQKMTLTNLLGHTAGFTHEAPIGNNSDLSTATFEEHIKSINDTWLMFPVGQQYNYSNNGPDLAAYIVQVQSGMPFEQYMQQKLLDPLGMTHSTFDITQIEKVQDRAIGHDQRVAWIPVRVPMLGAGGLYTNATDMAKYVQFQINQGVAANGKRLVPGSLLDTIAAPPSPVTRAQSVGYGVFVGRKYDTYYIGSGGGGFGFLSDMVWYPELKLGIVTLTNSADHKLQNVLSAQILDDLVADGNTIFHTRYIRMNNTTLAPWEKVPGAFSTAAPTPNLPAMIRALAPTPTEQDKLRWSQYVGTYEVRGWGQVPITAQLYEQDNHLYGRTPYGNSPLTEVQPGVFYLDNGESIDLSGPIPVALGTRLTRVTGSNPPGTPTGTP